MIKPLHYLLCLICIIGLISGCNKDEVAALYDKPNDLPPPIFQQLEQRGNFKILLQVIDKAGYRDILGKAGYWTFFAPNDEAFTRYFQEQGMQGIDQLDKERAIDIIRISTIYNAYRADNIDDFESPERMIIPNASFRKKSTYYEFGYDDINKTGKIISSNTLNGFVQSDNNNKYLQFFTQDFFTSSGVKVSDYMAFYPNAQYAGFNVMDASILGLNIIAENGVIHEIDRVLQPAPSLERYIASKPIYNEFKKLLDVNASYLHNYVLQTRFKALTGKNDSVFVKQYSNGLSFSPGSENFILGPSGTDAQADFFSMLVPTNESLVEYKRFLLKDWGSNELSPEMSRLLVNAHFYRTALWPSKFETTKNSLGQSSSVTRANVLDMKMASNGNFYYVNKVQEANEFTTVYSKPFLNKNYQLQTKGLDRLIRATIADPDQKWGLIMQSDDQFKSSGYSFNEVINEYQYTNPSTGATVVSTLSRDRFLRILYSSVFYNSFLRLSDLSGEGFLRGSNGEGEDGEYIYYKNGIIYGSGNVEKGTDVRITSKVETINGPVFYTEGSLIFAEQNLGAAIKALALKYPSQYGKFYDYLSKSTLWTAATTAIAGITEGVNYTVFIPTNAAIDVAIAEKKWPASSTQSAQTAIELDNLTSNLLYHFIAQKTFAPDGDPDKQGVGLTSFKDFNLENPNTFVRISSQPGSMQVSDNFGRTANVIMANRNKDQVVNRALVHSTDKVLLIRN